MMSTRPSTLRFRAHGRILDGEFPGKENRVYPQPAGVVATISPWNWPTHLSARSVVPALGLGNAVMAKPANQTPITGGLLLARLFEEAGPAAGRAQCRGRSVEDHRRPIRPGS